MPAFAIHPTRDARASVLVHDLLRGLLERRLVEGILAPCITRDGRSVQLALLRRADQVDQARPLLPVMPVSAARMAGMLCERVSGGGSPSTPVRRLAAVMRPCEARATVELAKLRQVDLAQLMMIVVDCVGTVEEPALRESGLAPEAVEESMLAALRSGELDSPLTLPYRHACAICVHPVAPLADLAVHWIGTAQGEGLLLEAKETGVLAELGLDACEDRAGRAAAVQDFVAARAGKRAADLDEFLAAMAPQPDGMPGLVAAFELCLRCGNCSTACPLCYCKECLFRTDALRQEPSRLLGLAERRGAARLPGDAMTFQLTRLNHVTTSCVGCGVCTSACPSHLPVDSLFQAVARSTQALFEYDPGRSLDDPLPTTTFQRDEFVRLGEA